MNADYGSKREETMATKSEVKEKLEIGQYKTSKSDPNPKSRIWPVFKPVGDVDGKDVHFVWCMSCGEVYACIRHPCISNNKSSPIKENCLPKAARDPIVAKCVGVLLYGPPGCAKTTLARALATYNNTTFLSISAAELYSPFFGDAERTVVELFHRARLGAPSILFVDEIDAMVGNRAEKERGVQERVLSAFLTEMDGIDVGLESAPSVQPENGIEDPALFNINGVIVIAATNRPDMLDDALLRPGRFDKLLYVPPPNSRGRQDILKKLLGRTPLSPCVDLNILAESTDFYSGADLMSLCKEAALHALTEEGMDVAFVCQRHFLQALDGLLPSMNKKLLDWYEKFNNSYGKF